MTTIVYSDVIEQVEPDHLHRNPDNPRTTGPGDVTELVDSIRESGVLEPLLVRTAHARFGPGHFIIDAGERRWTAGKSIPIALPCRIGSLSHGVDPVEHTLVTGLIENGHRNDLSAIEKAKAFERLQKEFGLTQGQIGKRVGLKGSSVSRIMNLLALAPRTQQAVVEGKLSITDANRLVVQHRQDQRRKAGRKPQQVEWEEPTLTGRHFLASKAKKLCSESEHNGNPVKLHGVACERHWEQAIRMDEAKVQQVAAREAGFNVPFTSPVMAAVGNSLGRGDAHE